MCSSDLSRSWSAIPRRGNSLVERYVPLTLAEYAMDSASRSTRMSASTELMSRIGDEANRSHDDVRGLSAKHAEIRFAHKLHAVEGAFRVIMEFENARDVCVHHATADAPFLVQQSLDAGNVRQLHRQKFQDYRRIRLPVAGQPNIGHTARAQPSNECISVGQPRTFFQYPHRM